MKVAFLHDWLITYGGAERVLEAMLEVFPDATVFTLIYEKENFKNTGIARVQVLPSGINRLPKVSKWYRRLLPVMPFVVEQFDVTGYDLVISSSHSVCHGVITTPDQLHIAYFNRTMQYAWDHYFRDLVAFGLTRGLISLVARGVYHYLRIWDHHAMMIPDVMVANSEYMKRRINKYSKRDAIVINPPVDISSFGISQVSDDYYVFVGRLVPIKRPDIVVDAFNRSGLKLLVIGDGPMLQELKARSGTNISFYGWANTKEISELVAKARALIFPSDEAFGIAAVEAQACGVPVVAFRAGGALETIEDGVSGVFFDKQDPDSINEAIIRAQTIHFDKGVIRLKAEHFGKERFKARIRELVDISMKQQCLSRTEQVLP